MINAFSKVHSLLDDIKNLAPELHKALNSSITDIEHAFGDIIDDIGTAIDPKHKSSTYDTFIGWTLLLQSV